VWVPRFPLREILQFIYQRLINKGAAVWYFDIAVDLGLVSVKDNGYLIQGKQ
jgi:hypothetical protein